eukprot:scaffold418142_cov35-Attheya_sp.AAC.1
MQVNETVYVPLLCAQMSTGKFEKAQNPDKQRDSTGSVLYIRNEKNESVKFWVFASDGISYATGKAYEK